MSARRIVIPRVGGPEVLTVEEFRPEPPGPDEVSIAVEAAGVNFADLFCRLGLYAAAPDVPFTPGFEAAGVVREVGEGVTRPQVGDRVLALTRFGGYTSNLNVAAAWTRPLPEGWSFAEGAAFPVVFLTAQYGLMHLARLGRGETVVVQSAAGGVGTPACQLSRAAGARVLGTVGSPAKREVAVEAGADEVVVSSRYRVWREVDRLTGGEGVDVVFDAVGGRGLREGYRRLRPGGRLVVYGFAEMMPRGAWRNWPLMLWRLLRMPRFAPLHMTSANRSVAGFNLVYLWSEAALLGSLFDELLELARRGTVRPMVGATFSAERVAGAHALVQSRRSTAKVVLTWGPEST